MRPLKKIQLQQHLATEGFFLLVACFHWRKAVVKKLGHLFQFHQLFRNPLAKAFLKDEEFVQKKLGPGEIVPPSLGVTRL